MAGLVGAMVLLLLVTAGVWAWREFYIPRLHRDVLLSLRDGAAITGVLMGQRGPWLLLRSASYTSPDGQQRETPLDGEQLVPRAQVLFVQVLPAVVAAAPVTAASPTAAEQEGL